MARPRRPEFKFVETIYRTYYRGRSFHFGFPDYPEVKVVKKLKREIEFDCGQYEGIGFADEKK